MSFWGGSFAPLRKHRDNAHDDFGSHVADNGGRYRFSHYVYVDTDPVTEEYYVDGPKVYIFVEVDMGAHQSPNTPHYSYLMPYDGKVVRDKSPNNDTTKKRVVGMLNEYNENPPVTGKRDVRDYIDLAASSRVEDLNLPPLDTTWKDMG